MLAHSLLDQFWGMPVSYLLPHLQAMFDIPSSTLTLLIIMCSAAMYYIRPHLMIPAMVFVLGPLTFTLAAVAYYGLTMLEYFPLNKTDQWLICTILSATIGVVIGLCLAAVVSKALDKSNAKQSRFHRA